MKKWLSIVFVGLCVAALARAEAGGAGDADDVERRVVELAETDHIALLQLVLENYRAQIKDYTGTFHKTERLGRRLGKEQVIRFKFKDEPFSVMMEWKKNAGGADKLLYVEGQNDNQMIVHPTGLLSWIRSVRRDPTGAEAMKTTLNPCTAFGVESMTERMLKVYQEAKAKGDLTTKYLGVSTVNGRRRVKLERVLPEKKEYPYTRILLEIDVEYLVPVMLECYDAKGNLMARYVYEDLKFNAGLKDEEFTAKANGL